MHRRFTESKNFRCSCLILTDSNDEAPQRRCSLAMTRVNNRDFASPPSHANELRNRLCADQGSQGAAPAEVGRDALQSHRGDRTCRSVSGTPVTTDSPPISLNTQHRSGQKPGAVETQYRDSFGSCAEKGLSPVKQELDPDAECSFARRILKRGRTADFAWIKARTPNAAGVRLGDERSYRIITLHQPPALKDIYIGAVRDDVVKNRGFLCARCAADRQKSGAGSGGDASANNSVTRPPLNASQLRLVLVESFQRRAPPSVYRNGNSGRPLRCFLPTSNGLQQD